MDEKILEELSASPIYAMSLGNHELFHSNFLAWLMQKCPETIQIFFDELKTNMDENIDISRELKNKDITIIKNNETYVIENKFKSVPYESQLKKYEEDTGDSFRKGCLLCLRKPHFNLNNWNELEYSVMLERMKTFMNEYQGNALEEFDKRVIEEYIKTTEITVGIIKNSLKSDSLQLASKCFKNVEKYRLADILRKLNAIEFLKACKQDIINEVTIDEKYLYIGTDYTRKNAIIDAFVLLQDDTFLDSEDNYITNKEVHYKLLIGIQIQGNQFKYSISKPKNKVKNIDELYNEFVKCDWFDAEWLSSKNNKYNKYLTSKNDFIFQYENLRDEDLSFENIKNKIIASLNSAVSIIRDSDYRKYLTQ